MPTEVRARHRGARILIVDPDGPLRHVLTRALEAENFVVVASHDVGIAREMLDAGVPFDLVVTNVPLDLGGHVDFLDELEADFPAIPILHLSGPVFQGRSPMHEGGFSVPRFLAAVRHCLATGRCDPPPEERRSQEERLPSAS